MFNLEILDASRLDCYVLFNVSENIAVAILSVNEEVIWNVCPNVGQ